MLHIKKQTPKSKNRGCLWTILIFVVLYFAFIAYGAYVAGRGTTLDSGSIYHLELTGTLTEQGQEDNPFASLLADMPYGNYQTTVGLDDILSNIRLAKDDDRISGIFLDGGDLAMGPAQAMAIRRALLDFRLSGKWVVAYAHSYSGYCYYVASAADYIAMNPSGALTWHGAMAAKMYYKRLFDKLGVDMQILKVGTFKSAVEPYFRTSMSEADRRQTMTYISGIWDEMVDAVAQSRGISHEALNRYADQVLEVQDASLYVDYGMVDTLVYVQSMDSILYALCDGKPTKMTTSDLASVKRPSSRSHDKIAVVYADGDITDDSNEGIGGKQFVRLLGKVLRDDDVRAVVLRVNSPGGSADASEQIWHAEQLIREKGLPLVVSMGTYAASGGYYISCSADTIFAEPTTITGSIGIFGVIPSYSGLRDKVGIDIDGIQTNAHSLMFTNMIYNGMNPDEQALMQRMIERGYDLFTRRCADGRHMSQDSIKAIAEGRVWLGSDALRLGLIDRFGGIDDAIACAARMAHLDDYALTVFPERKDFLTQLLESMDDTTEEERLMLRIRDLVKSPSIHARMEDIVIK